MSNIDPLTTCLQLRSKEMYYEVPGPEAEEHDEEALDARMYWCECTQTGRGPDGQPAGRRECARTQRSCFVSVESLT